MGMEELLELLRKATVQEYRDWSDADPMTDEGKVRQARCMEILETIEMVIIKAQAMNE
jgi:hypothetical protein